MLQSQSSGWLFETDMHPGNVSKSVRFDDGSSSYLHFTPSSEGDRKRCTISAWVKRAKDGDSGGVEDCVFHAGTASGHRGHLRFYEDHVNWNYYNGSSWILYLITTDLFRDTANWYHLCANVDTAAGTAKLWVNGVEPTLSNNTIPSSSQDLSFADDVEHQIGQRGYGDTGYFDGYIAGVNFIEGQALDVSNFGADVNGVWLPKSYSGNYGTNGFRLSFSQTGTSANSSGMGADTSGNGNHFTPANLTAADVFDDAPSNNFCTLNFNGRRYGSSHKGTFSQGNLKVASGGNATDVFGTMAINQVCAAGGVYFEIRLDSIDTSRTYFGLIGDTGVNNKNDYANGASYSYPTKAMVQSGGYMYFGTQTNGSAETNIGGGALSGDYRSIATYADGDVIGFAVKSDGKIFVSKNGTFINSLAGAADPDNGTNPIHVIDLDEGDWVPYVGYNSTFSVNFGQDDTYAGAETSNGVTGGGGKFLYAPPSWAKALCSRNLPESSLSSNPTNPIGDPTNAFNTFLYTGTNASNRNLALNTFTPDFVWLKSRSGADNHVLVDSLRRDGDNFPNIHANVTDQQTSDSHPKIITNGVQVSQGLYDNDTVTFATWCWKAGGAPTADNSGGQNPTSGSVMIDGVTSTAAFATASIYPTRMSVNTHAGFSIVTYTGSTASGALTVPHGLGKKPEWVIVKRTDASSDWIVGHRGLADNAFTNNKFCKFTSDGLFTNSLVWGAEPTTTLTQLVSDGSGGASNLSSSGTYVMYSWTSIDGFSKFGSYTANESTDGIFIYLGFRPAWAMIKRTAGNGWAIQDSKRTPNNPVSNLLQANENQSEYTTGVAMDFVSNGIKMRNDSGFFNHVAGDSFIYMAFADGSFKDINAR